jgi:hypothetical protein
MGERRGRYGKGWQPQIYCISVKDARKARRNNSLNSEEFQNFCCLFP